jgi:hypothetical protein
VQGVALVCHDWAACGAQAGHGDSVNFMTNGCACFIVNRGAFLRALGPSRAYEARVPFGRPCLRRLLWLMAWLLLDLIRKSAESVWPNLRLALGGVWQGNHETYE